MALLGAILIGKNVARLGRRSRMLANCGSSSSGSGAVKSQVQRMHVTSGEATAIA